MQFNAKVSLSESQAVLKRQQETAEARALMLKALSILAKEDESILEEAEAYLQGGQFEHS